MNPVQVKSHFIMNTMKFPKGSKILGIDARGVHVIVMETFEQEFDEYALQAFPDGCCFDIGEAQYIGSCEDFDRNQRHLFAHKRPTV